MLLDKDTEIYDKSISSLPSFVLTQSSRRLHSTVCHSQKADELPEADHTISLLGYATLTLL